MDDREYYRELYSRLTLDEVKERMLHDKQWLRLIHKDGSVVDEVVEEIINDSRRSY